MQKLTQWGRATHICVGNLTIIGSYNGLSPGRRQAITWTNVGILLIGPLGTNFSEMLIEIHTFSFKKIYLKMSSGKWRPFYLGLNVLNARPRKWWMATRTHSWKDIMRIWNVTSMLIVYLENYAHHYHSVVTITGEATLKNIGQWITHALCGICLYGNCHFKWCRREHGRGIYDLKYTLAVA